MRQPLNPPRLTGFQEAIGILDPRIPRVAGGLPVAVQAAETRENNMTTAPTVRGAAVLETDVPLADLRTGDLVLGSPTDDLPVRTLHRVTATFGQHKVPFEEAPSWMERTFLAGSKVEGILVEGIHDGGQAGTPALFALETTPVLDRVTGWAA